MAKPRAEWYRTFNVKTTHRRGRMRKRATYPMPSYTDPKDRRLVSLIRMLEDPLSSAVNILGVPFDGAVLGRKGAAEGPAAIRKWLRGFSNFDRELGVDILKARVADLGDVEVGSGDVETVHRLVRSEVKSCLSEGSLLVVLGGDNSLSLPSITAAGEVLGKVGLVVFDSHFDLRGPIDGRPTSGSSYGMALRKSKGVEGSRFAEIGLHGFLNSKAYAREAERLGAAIFTAKQVREEGALAVVKRAYRIASRGTDAVYVSVDLDCLDVSYVSGVSAPSVGGIGAPDLMEMLRFLAAEKKVACADIVELAPALDPTEKSALVAATALVSLIAGFAQRKS
jgi:formiminoglutamase